MSNFYPCQIEYEGLVYPSVENAYQAAKVNNPEDRKKFINITPGKSKKLGNQVLHWQNLREQLDKCEGYLDWHLKKLDVMEKLLRIKFKDQVLAKSLVDTYPETLIEGNTWGDTFWGTVDGIGKNNLGNLLMKIRKEIVDEKSRDSGGQL